MKKPVQYFFLPRFVFYGRLEILCANNVDIIFVVHFILDRHQMLMNPQSAQQFRQSRL